MKHYILIKKIKYVVNLKHIKIMSVILIGIIFITSFSSAIAFNRNTKNMENSGLECYGFIVKLVKNNIYTNDQFNCKIRHMINDILREDFQVYWTSENITVDVKDMNTNITLENLFFERGSFIIPFTGDETKDNKLISITYDYNQSSEIDYENDLSIPIYLIMEPITAQVYPLNEVKIALFKNRVTCGESLYIGLLKQCGFLNYDIIWDYELNSKLNTDDYNIMFHAGGILEANKLVAHMIYEDVVYREADGVRSFVNNGGGYVGVCHGLVKASAGMLYDKIPIPIYLRRRVYNPNLRSIGVYAIADILFNPYTAFMGDCQVKITSGSSPITYGLGNVVWDCHIGGPQVCYTGKNIEVVARFHNTQEHFNNTPSWITTPFGDGKVIIFVTHPEIAGIKNKPTNITMNNVGKTTISNSLYHSTADEKIEYQTIITKNLSYLEEIWEKTSDLTRDLNQTETLFDIIRSNINETQEYMDNISVNISNVILLIKDIASKNNVNISSKLTKYYIGYEYSKDILLYMNLLTPYLKNTTSVLDVIENIYCLFENDSDFNQQLEVFIDDISNRLNDTKQILEDTIILIENFYQKLLKYEKWPIRIRIREYKLNNIAMDNYLHVFNGFSKLPKIYFNSLKFLRYHWYNYESNIID